ncbi:hypothetical protein [Niabella aquatica]
MKKQLFSILILGGLLTTAIQLSSCKKDDTTTTPNSSNLSKGKSAVTAAISGAHNAEYKSAETMSTVIKQGFISINSSASGALTGGALAEQFIIYLPLNIKVGSFNSKDFPSADPAKFTYTILNTAGAKGYTSGADGTSVNFNITKSTTEEVEGTFDGTMGEEETHKSIKVKGSFAAKY